MLITSQLLFIGATEIALIVGVVLLLFGGKKVPELMRGLGRGVKEFKEGAREVQEPFENAKKELESAVND